MKLLDWLKSLTSKRGKAVSVYKQGMEKAKLQDHPGAIEDYTTAIGMSETPPDVKAMALYNRALVYASDGENSKATVDLNAILNMRQDLTHIKTEARRRLVRMDRKSGKSIN